jgi:hypothetical protein
MEPGDTIDASSNSYDPEYVDIQTSVEEDPDDGEIRVTRSAAFTELANKPTDVALHDAHIKNQVHFFDDLREFDPELAGTIAAQSQAATSGMHVSHPAIEEYGTIEYTDLEEEITEECKRLIDRLDLREDGATFFRDLACQGNDVSWVEYTEGEGVTDMTVLPLRALTILDHRTFQNREPPEGTQTGENFRRTISSADWYVINEDTDAEQAYPAHDILHLALNRRRNWHVDLMGRPTFSVWGEGRLKSTEYALQAKQNTLANKVAYDDKILAREIYKINVEDLFGQIRDPEERRQEAKKYAKELRKMLENLKPDQKPVIPEEVSVEVVGPDGDTARNMSDFIQTMNDSIQHALTFHVASFGRDAGGTERGNRPAKEMSENSVRHLREVLKAGFKRLFEIHTLLVFPEAREQVSAANDIRRYELKEDITLPTIAFDPVDPNEMIDTVRSAATLYEKGIIDFNEARVFVDHEPLEDEEIEEMYFLKNPTTKDEDIEMMEMEHEMQNQDSESPADDDGGGATGGHSTTRTNDTVNVGSLEEVVDDE